MTGSSSGGSSISGIAGTAVVGGAGSTGAGVPASSAASSGMPSRSAAVHKAVRLLRTLGLGAAYEHAWSEWSADGDSEVWEAVISDGVA